MVSGMRGSLRLGIGQSPLLPSCPARTKFRTLPRGVFRSLIDLHAAINRYLSEHNRKPKPFLWTADPNRIIEKTNRGHQVLASDH
jgi:hypothetical protein